MSTLTEQILDRVQSVLLLAATNAGQSVFRNQNDDAVAESDLPMVRIRRGAVSAEVWAAGIMKGEINFSLEFWVCGDDYENQLDTLHLQCTRALFADADFSAMHKGFSESGSEEPQEHSGEVRVASMTANYKVITMYRAADPARRP